MSKHTPGPWKMAGDGTPFVYALNSGGSNRFSLSIQRGWDDDGGDVSHDERMDNARLIAAAPDMLEVLQTIENDAGQVPGWLWDRIQAAIAKATGTDREVTEADVLGGGS